MLRVAPKAASNRYPYLLSSCSRAQIFSSYIQMRQYVIWRSGEASMYTIFPSFIGGRVEFFDFHNGIMNLIE